MDQEDQRDYAEEAANRALLTEDVDYERAMEHAEEDKSWEDENETVPNHS